jgi:hypothetical protein
LKLGAEGAECLFVELHAAVRVGVEVACNDDHAVLGKFAIVKTESVIDGVYELLLSDTVRDVHITAEERAL